MESESAEADEVEEGAATRLMTLGEDEAAAALAAATLGEAEDVEEVVAAVEEPLDFLQVFELALVELGEAVEGDAGDEELADSVTNLATLGPGKVDGAVGSNA